jgi:hypothetical protein
MTATPSSDQQPLISWKRVIGISALACGLFINIGLLLWLLSYLGYRDLNLLQMAAEGAYWWPVLVFVVPGLHFTYYGIRLIRNDAVTVYIYLEFLLMLGILLLTGMSLLGWIFP